MCVAHCRMPRKNPTHVTRQDATPKQDAHSLQEIAGFLLDSANRGAPREPELVGGLNPSEKCESQLGWLFPIYGKMSKMATKPPTSEIPWISSSWNSMFNLVLLFLAETGIKKWCQAAPVESNRRSQQKTVGWSQSHLFFSQFFGVPI